VLAALVLSLNNRCSNAAAAGVSGEAGRRELASQRNSSMSQLSGKVALVTGGSRGIGAATAKRLAKDGADVAITYVSSPDKANAVVAEIKAVGPKAVAIKADSADAAATSAAVEKTVAELGRLDILVNNAGVFTPGAFEEVSVADLDRI
jgi:NAD(P)-dependent dehydrogenase (short-subunit alcohol dehydrogenase family)